MSSTDFSSLHQHLQPFVHSRDIPPVADWQPQFCGEMDLVIKANGEWWHNGSPIQRPSMIALFSKVLWQENQVFFLKTPIEKIQIHVEDAPFQINRVQQVEHDGQIFIQFLTPQEDAILLTDTQQIQFLARPNPTGELEYRPYLHVRFGLLGLIQRSVFYHWINLGELNAAEHGTLFTIQSGGKALTWLIHHTD